MNTTRPPMVACGSPGNEGDPSTTRLVAFRYLPHPVVLNQKNITWREPLSRDPPARTSRKGAPAIPKKVVFGCRTVLCAGVDVELILGDRDRGTVAGWTADIDRGADLPRKGIQQDRTETFTDSRRVAASWADAVVPYRQKNLA